MTSPSGPEIIDGDSTAIVRATEDAADGPVYSLVEFDLDRYHTLYVHETTRAMYESSADMERHFDRIHAHVNLDFTRRSCSPRISCPS